MFIIPSFLDNKPLAWVMSAILDNDLHVFGRLLVQWPSSCTVAAFELRGLLYFYQQHFYDISKYDLVTKVLLSPSVLY
jgi:hypothetical protein